MKCKDKVWMCHPWFKLILSIHPFHRSTAKCLKSVVRKRLDRKYKLKHFKALFISVACQAPPEYTYQSANKYYKPMNQTASWTEAKDACNIEGAILVEPKNALEYLAIQKIFGKIQLQHNLILTIRMSLIFSFH